MCTRKYHLVIGPKRISRSFGLYHDLATLRLDMISSIPGHGIVLDLTLAILTVIRFVFESYEVTEIFDIMTSLSITFPFKSHGIFFGNIIAYIFFMKGLMKQTNKKKTLSLKHFFHVGLG